MRWLALASIAIGLAASAQDLTSSPAHFREGERSLISRLRLPERLADGDYLVRCAGKAMSSGTLRDVTCHRGEPGDFDRLIERIVVATRKTKVTPARYNAKATRVWFDFSVRVIKRGADVQVASYPHHFNNASLYGESYSAPQRVAASTKYIAKCGTIALIMAAASIDAAGNAHEATILKSHNEESESCFRAIERELRESQYVPAFHDGRAVPAVYMEVFYTSAPVSRFLPPH